MKKKCRNLNFAVRRATESFFFIRIESPTSKNILRMLIAQSYLVRYFRTDSHGVLTTGLLPAWL